MNFPTFSLLLLLPILFICGASSYVTADNSCTPLSLGNGSSITFADPSLFVGYFPALHQTGVNAGTFPWAASLCDTTGVPRPDHSPDCALGRFLVMDDCNITFIYSATISPLRHQVSNEVIGAQFLYKKSFVGDYTYFAEINCTCDANSAELSSSPNYIATAEPSDDKVITFSFNFASSGCCASKDTALPSTTDATDVNVSSTTVAPTTTAASTASSTTTPSPDSNSNTTHHTADEDEGKKVGFGFLGAILGIGAIVAGYIVWKKYCRSDRRSATKHFEVENTGPSYSSI